MGLGTYEHAFRCSGLVRNDNAQFWLAPPVAPTRNEKIKNMKKLKTIIHNN